MNRKLSLSALVALCSLAAANAQDLREAVRSGNVERVKSLLKAGADVNQHYENRFTPIYFASDPDVVEVLVANGAKLNVRDSALLQSPLESAAEKYFRDEEGRATWKAIVTKLRASGAEYTVDVAIYMSDIAFLKERLSRDTAWVNNRDGAQCVPLRVAARTGRAEIFKLLLEKGADPNGFEEGNGFPIMVDAVGHPAIVKLLIDNKANLRRRITWLGGSTGMRILGGEASALHYAVEAGNLESVKLLVLAGLDPNAADDEGQTPLHAAIRFERLQNGFGRDGSGLVKIMEYLLANDASLRFTDKTGKTVLDLAKSVQSPQEVLQLLLQRKAELERRRA